MEDNYVYISVKLTLKDGQTEDSVQEIVQDMDYSFVHSDILETEIIDILDTQVSADSAEYENEFVDPYDMSHLAEF